MLTDHGILISFDGPPRSGRTYQADALAASLTTDGHDVLRVSMPPDDVPLAKTTLAWLDGRLAQYRALVDAEIAPALAAGRVVILDGGVTSLLIRARAVLGANAPLGMLYVRDVLAMRPAPVDLEWIFLDAREGERRAPGFDVVDLWKAGACCHAPASAWPDATSCGARRHATYLLRAKHADAAMANFPTIVAHLQSERLGDAWAAVVAETREARDRAIVARRMAQWTHDQPMPLYGALAPWAEYTDAERLALVEAIPAHRGAVAAFVRVLRALGVAEVSEAVNAVLAAKDAAEVVAEAERVAREQAEAVDATEAPTAVAG